MEYPLVDYNNCGDQVGGTAAFICTECGDGFSHYPDLLNHMVIHGPVDPFPFDCPPSSFGTPLEFALHENGMLTVVDRSVELNYFSPATDKPQSPDLIWSQDHSLESQSAPVLPPTEALPLEAHSSTVTLSPNQDRSLESHSAPIILTTNQPLPSESQLTPVTPSPTKAQRGSSKSLVPTYPARFRCETCGQLFNTRSGLQRHQRYRTLERGFKCTLCCKIFNEREELRQHLQEHAHERFYSCGHCGKRFLHKEALHAHQEERHGKAVSKTSKVSGEVQENSTDKSYPCKLCGLRFFWLSDLQSHLLSHAHGKIVSCISTYDTPAPQKKTQQDEKSHDGKPNTALPKRTHKRQDTAPSLNTSFRPYRCGLCGNRFQQLSDLKLHHLSHQTQEDFVSPEQEPKPKQVQSGAASKQQIQSGAPAKEAKPRGRPPRGNQANHNARVYPCKLCHRVFVHSSSLSRHMRYHKGTLHTCVYCGRHFPQRCDVRRHIAMYHNAQGTQSKAETEKAVAESRRDIHLQQPQLKPHLQCPLKQTEKGASERKKDSSNCNCIKCGKIFLDSSERDKHGCNSQHSCDPKEAESSPKPRVTFQCSVCGKGFGLLCVYQRHQRYHRRELAGEIHKCPRCPRRFRQSCALIRHLETHQSLSPGEEDKEAQISPTTGSSQDPTLVLEHDEDLEDEEDLEEEEASGGIAAEVLYECTECTQTFSSLVTFLQHQSAHGSDSLG
ncbi:zinc finger protein 184 [Scleropages formosus]|uniref:Zinc finger protein 184-like n=1 Tax=Scleropages formosus TaxID=113540 RepID=A0A8C9S1S2_SCLFO|nr:zinc finger protein 184-like [Scleropages formosus]